MQDLRTLPDIERFIFSQAVLASGANPADPDFEWNWSAEGVRRARKLAAELHEWIDCSLRTVGEGINELNPVNKLPPEILRIIFSLATARDQAAQLRLSTVCKRWKAVALDHPVLWSKVDVRAKRYATPDTLLDNLGRQLAYAKDVPTDLALYHPPCGPILHSTHTNPLEDHMFHLRSLDLRLPSSALEQHFRVALTMPVPLLVSLELYVTPIRDTDFPFGFPFDLFSGHAPCLRRLSLIGLTVPSPAWQPLAGSTHLSVSFGTVALSDLVRVVQACARLSFLLVAADDCVVPPDWSSVPKAQGRSPSSASLSVRPVLPDASPLDVAKFLSYAGHPVVSYLDVDWEQTNDAWAWMAEPAGDTTFARVLRDPASRRRGMRVTARTRAGHTRSTHLRIHRSRTPLLQVVTFFHSLEELVVGERFWPLDTFPHLPRLETMTIVLDGPYSADEGVADFAGIFFFPLDRSATWALLALRTMRLSRINLDVEQLPGEPSATAALSSPLVVSAHDIAVFLTWHLTGPQPLDLILHNVITYEGDHHDETRLLNSIVASVSFTAGDEEEDPFARERM
ncbi:hypothetical protein AURDEDRAFT_175455 [Auricularia subglabra TFB-10046 SS5]|uniref:F-box domain-containing protein n=1 Tax=Auricularia subglabra (strain TFB-10046 / SS5) TaxID=717982 RepID=J0D8E1_AURST|nr:hypothetical protein AURDEDRAFT_175455 [Auricularia subglabra TFB-10046 SS5]